MFELLFYLKSNVEKYEKEKAKSRKSILA